MPRLNSEISLAHHVALVMMSDFDRSAGGRETWAYNFIPRLLDSDPRLLLTVYGMRTNAANDHSAALLDAVGTANRSRVKVILIDVRRGRLPYFFSMFAGLARHARKSADPLPEHTLGVGGLFEMLLMLGCRRFRASRKILWLRGIFFDEKADRIPPALRGAARRTEGLLLSRAELLLTNGEDIRVHYARYGLDSLVIENGVDCRRWSMPGPPLGSVLRVGYIGRLSKVKGIEEFLELAQRAQAGSAVPRFEFHVIGAGPYAQQALALQAKGILTYHGPLPSEALPAALERLDICVALTFSSTQLGGGGTSNALMEQMAAGRVIVAWDNVIFRQLLDEQSGYLVAQGDVEGLLRAIEDIAQDRRRALARSLAGKSVVAAFSLDAQLDRFHAAVTSASLAWRQNPVAHTPVNEPREAGSCPIQIE